jgi:hypothetical protein
MTTRPLFFGCLTRIGLAVAIVALCRAAGADLPTDPFQRTAITALRGDFGHLQEWQREGYQRGLDQGATVGHKFHLTYYTPRSCRGTRGASGQPVSTRMAASNRLPQWSWVWLPNVGIRQVLDRGARWNDTLADRASCHSWLDLWFPSTAAAHRAGVTGRCAVTGAVIGA